jgi:ubiquinone biosynthesis protein
MDPGLRRACEVGVVSAARAAAALLGLLDMRVLLPGIHRSPAGTTPAGPAELRALLEELGPTFMKLGQVLSTRPDLVPPSYEAELAQLQDSGPTVPFAGIRAAVEHTLGRPLRELYAEFDEHAIAAASIGQVHAATLHDGTAVVVKVRRPGVVDRIELDLDVMARASRIAGRVGVLARYDPEGLAREFATTLRGELDYSREAYNAEQLAAGSTAMHASTFPGSSVSSRAPR